MTRYTVLTEPAAAEEMDAAHASIEEHVSPESADRWLDAILRAAHTLDAMPTRCPRAAESDDCDEPIYQLLVGRRPHVYRMLFVVRERHVHVVHVRHGARRPLTADELRLLPIDPDGPAGVK